MGSGIININKSAVFDRWILWVTHMGRRTHSPVRERKDYTRLLSELQGKTPSSPAEVAVAAQDEEKEPYSTHRQRIMSDEKVKYLYSRNGGMLHDKPCLKRGIFRTRSFAAQNNTGRISLNVPSVPRKPTSVLVRRISITSHSMRSTLSGCGSPPGSSDGCM